MSPAQKYLQKLRARAQGQVVNSAAMPGPSKPGQEEYAAFEVEATAVSEQRRRRTGPEVGSEHWANDVANRAAMVVELTRGWDTRGRVESELSKEEAYAKFLAEERDEQAARARAKSEPPKPLVEAPAAAPMAPPKLAKGKITGVAGPKVMGANNRKKDKKLRRPPPPRATGKHSWPGRSCSAAGRI